MKLCGSIAALLQISTFDLHGRTTDCLYQARPDQTDRPTDRGEGGSCQPKRKAMPPIIIIITTTAIAITIAIPAHLVFAAAGCYPTPSRSTAAASIEM